MIIKNVSSSTSPKLRHNGNLAKFFLAHFSMNANIRKTQLFFMEQNMTKIQKREYLKIKLYTFFYFPILLKVIPISLYQSKVYTTAEFFFVHNCLCVCRLFNAALPNINLFSSLYGRIIEMGRWGNPLVPVLFCMNGLQTVFG